jgi:choice-of-anchor B domain-containing protein
VYKNHAYIVSDNANSHGVQVFDLTNLRGVTEFTTFSETNHYSMVGDVHNIHINEATGFAYAVGIGSAANSELRCGGGSHIIDLNDPANPTFAGCFAHEGTGRSGTGYTHDIQVVVYNGPDEQYKGREIAFSSNETALSIADLTDKLNPKIISKYDGSNFGYVHQGWLTEDHKYFIVNDELNESRGYDDNQTTIIFDVSKLDNPKLLTIYNSGLNTIDHNNYTRGNILFQSNYTAGLRILSIANIINPVEIAFFDTYPSGDRVAFNGSWSNYPYFESGTIVVTSIEEGLYILKINEEVDLAIDDNKTLPDNFDLKQNYPNPFNPITQIQYELPKAGVISLTLYNMLGIEVMQLDNGFKPAGIHRISLNGSHLSSGIYFYQLRTEGYVRTRKMSLIK